LISKGIKNPHKRSDAAVIPGYEYRKISIPTVIKKLYLSEYVKDTPSRGYQQVNRVRIPLNRHAGAPALPRVVPGEKVKMGDVIASSPPDQVGAVHHASIAGTVTEITHEWIEICK
jgi:Na+-translocating ferredoxin:NAD+ oxidoreductase RnfC subunit